MTRPGLLQLLRGKLAQTAFPHRCTLDKHPACSYQAGSGRTNQREHEVA